MSHTYAEPARDQQRETSLPSQETESPILSRPPVACAAPADTPQGGLADWFRNIFSSREPGAPEQQWEREEYGNVDPQYVTDKPDADSPLSQFVQTYTQEGPGQAPVFETHSFMPREEVDNEGMGHLHSFIGLRFTQLDPVTARYTRKRLKVGFGGGGHAFAPQGTLMDDTNTQADMSTETPITRDQLESVMAVIPEKTQEPYNVLTHNCNHFTQQLAAMVGASIPAQLHDTPLGPMAAYKNLANAAENGNQGRTRFFQGGGLGKWTQTESQMAGERGKQFVTHFMDAARPAARRDGVPFLLNPRLAAAAEQVSQAALPMQNFLGPFSIASAADAERLENTTHTVTEKAQDLIHLHLWKSHPRVNITAMKVIAMANHLHSTFLPKRRALTNYSQQELDASLSQRTDAEREAAAQDDGPSSLHRVDNEQLFTSDRTQLTAAGDIFLQSIGIMPGAIVQQYSMSEGKPLDLCISLMEQIAGALTGEAGMGINNYLAAFFHGRDNLTNEQLGALATQSILDVLVQEALQSDSPLERMLNRTRIYTNALAQARSQDSLDNDSTESTKRISNSFTGKQNAAVNDLQRQSQQDRQKLLDLINTMEATMATKFEAVRALAAQTSTQQDPGEE